MPQGYLPFFCGLVGGHNIAALLRDDIRGDRRTRSFVFSGVDSELIAAGAAVYISVVAQLVVFEILVLCTVAKCAVVNRADRTSLSQA